MLKASSVMHRHYKNMSQVLELLALPLAVVLVRYSFGADLLVRVTLANAEIATAMNDQPGPLPDDFKYYISVP